MLPHHLTRHHCLSVRITFSGEYKRNVRSGKALATERKKAHPDYLSRMVMKTQAERGSKPDALLKRQEIPIQMPNKKQPINVS